MAVLHVLPTLLNIIPKNSARNSARYQFYLQFKTFGEHAIYKSTHCKRLYLCLWDL